MKKLIKKYYHITKNTDQESILKYGLLPGREVGINNEYFGVRGNPDYIYLWSREIIVKVLRGDFPINRDFYDPQTNTIVEVSLPPEYPVERDYDQILVYLDMFKKRTGRFSDIGPDEKFVKPLRKFYKQLFDERFGIEFKGRLTKENLVRHVDAISDKMWDERQFSYRTLRPIKPEHLKVIKPEQIVYPLSISFLP